MSTRTKRLLKSTRAMCLASAFVLASSFNIYATEVNGSASSAGATVPPYFSILDQRTPSELTIAISDSEMVNYVTMAKGAAADAEAYILMASYQICAASNAVDVSSSKAGFLMKIVTSSGFTDTSVTNSQTQLAFKNNSNSDAKIRFLLHVTPAGETTYGETFGNDGSADGSTGQFGATAFVIGADVAVQGTASVKLNNADATSIGSATTHENLSVNNWGTINHYAVSGGAALSLSDGTTTSGGISTSEGLTISGCSMSQLESDPTSTAGNGLITIKLYGNVNDLAAAGAGSYTATYALSTADIDDSVTGTVYDDTA